MCRIFGGCGSPRAFDRNGQGAPELEARPGSSLEVGGVHRYQLRRGGGTVTSGRSAPSAHGPTARESRNFHLGGSGKGDMSALV